MVRFPESSSFYKACKEFKDKSADLEIVIGDKTFKVSTEYLY